MNTIVWFRQDLRLDDNPALGAALASPGGILPVYLHAPAEEGDWPPGGATRWWLHHSLARLAEQLERRGSRLCLAVTDDSLAELLRLARLCGAERVVWNRRYEPAAMLRDRAVKAALRAAGLSAESHSGALLREPWAVQNKSGGPFQVFTPFWRHCLSLPEPAAPTPAPAVLPAPSRWPESRPLGELGLLPRTDWAGGLRSAWVPGSVGAASLLRSFLDTSFSAYPEQRNRPDHAGTSRLSPHLHFGEISPGQIWHATRLHAEANAAGVSKDAGRSDAGRSDAGRSDAGPAAAGGSTAPAWRQSPFLAEVGWREFAYHLLYHFPATPLEPLRGQFARFPWRRDDAALARWRRGLTGFPLVDAGMRQLWTTGWMHNRVRMIAGSFLVKDLLIPWQAGARWFWDTLVDADLASNTLGWQWVAGCGADAAPYFRIFNPVLQGQKFDPEGGYVRRWIPELARLPAAWIHQPWAAPAPVLAAAGIVLGIHYPQPIVDRERARAAALEALAASQAP